MTGGRIAPSEAAGHQDRDSAAFQGEVTQVEAAALEAEARQADGSTIRASVRAFGLYGLRGRNKWRGGAVGYPLPPSAGSHLPAPLPEAGGSSGNLLYAQRSKQSAGAAERRVCRTASPTGRLHLISDFA